MNPINEFKADRKVQQTLRKDPNNVEALLQLATRLGTLKELDLAQKRKVLHRILFLEPTHRKARTMLLEMDRAAIGGDPSRLHMAVILTDPSSSAIGERPLLLRYSLVHQVMVYSLIGLTGLIGMSSVRNPQALIIAGAVLLILIIPFWFVSVMIEIDDHELNVSHLFGMAPRRIAWRDIKTFTPNARGRGIKIIVHKGRVVAISSRITGYSAVIEILRQMRPDVFDLREDAGMADVDAENERIAYN